MLMKYDLSDLVGSEWVCGNKLTDKTESPNCILVWSDAHELRKQICRSKRKVLLNH